MKNPTIINPSILLSPSCPPAVHHSRPPGGVAVLSSEGGTEGVDLGEGAAVVLHGQPRRQNPVRSQAEVHG